MSSAARVTKKPKSKSTGTPTDEAEGPSRPVRRFTVEEYHQLIEIGVLKPGDPFELIHGWIVKKMPTNPRHTKVSRRIIERVCPLFIGTGWVIGIQQPITVGDSEPEPDFYAASGPADKYDDRQPGAKDVAFVIEVADTSLGFDQTTKLELYAAAKIAVYWIVNLKDRRVEVYTQPRGGKNPTYKQQTNYGPDDAVPVVVAGKQVGRIPVKELLP